MTESPAVATGKKRRGRENARDMLLSLGVVFLLVVPLWYFGQASPGDSKRVRPVDPTEALRSFVTDTGGPVPATTPEGWVVNVRSYADGLLRVGYVLSDGYVEFYGSTGTDFLPAATGKAKRVSAVDVSGVAWQEYRSADGHESLVRSAGRATVVVGGVREVATLDQLKVLAATVR